MTNKKSTKSALISSVIALFLCFTMLLGTTFAWFTDSVTSAGNIIKSGTLNVEMYYADGSKTVPADNSTDWKNAQGVAIYTANQLWEPGYTDAKHIKISNEGTLALKYQLAIIPTGTVSDLAEVIDVYLYQAAGVLDNATQVATRDAVDPDMYVGTLADVISKGIIQGTLAADTDYTTTIVLKMRENAGNEYQDKSIGDDFTIQLLATQYTAESDGFDNQYDEGAWAPGMQVYTADDLQAAINNGETNITLMDDIELNESIVVPAAPTTYSLRNATPAVVINLNGKTITTAYNESTGKHAYAIDNYGSLVINGGTIEARGIYNREDATLTVNETEIVNLDMNGGSCIWSYGGEVYINNATLIGYTGCVYSEGYLEINGGTYTCYSAVTDDGEQISPTYNIRSTGELVINGGDFTSRHGLLAIKGSAEINGGTYTMTSIGVITSHVFYVYGDSSNVVVNDGTFNCDLRTAQNNGSSMICVDAANVTVNVYGGTFNLTPEKYVADGYHALQAGGMYFVVPNGISNVVTSRDELQAALDAATGDTTILVGADITGDVIVSQKEGVNIVIDGNDYKYDGTINVHGNSRHTGAETLVIKNIDFVTDKTLDFISSNDGGNSVIRYAHNVTIEDCTFTNNGTGTVVPARFRQAYNITIKNCEVDGTFSVMWTTGVSGLTVDNVTANCTNEGIHVGTSDDVLIKNCNITVAGANGFGIRADATGAYTLTVTDCTFDAAKDIVLRNAVAAYKATVDGVPFVATSQGLQAAIADGKTEIILADGDFIANLYDISARDTLIITGQGADTKLAFSNLQVRASQFNTLTIKNCTIERMPNKAWGHLVFGSSNNANGVYTISNCIFNGVGSQGIYINEDASGATYNIEDCVFNGDFGREGAITIQNNADVNVNVNVSGCTFNNIPETSNEIFVHYENKGLNLTVDGKVTVANATMLADAVSKGATEINLLPGEYDVYGCGGKTLTINGSRDAIIFVNDIDSYEHSDGGFDGSKVTFNGVTIKTPDARERAGYARMSGVYNDCAIIGNYSLFGDSTFVDCDFNANVGEHNVWTYGAANVSFTGCDFIYGDRCINVYLDNGTGSVNVSFDDCTFTTTNTASKGAVEINSSVFPQGANVSFDGCTGPDYGTMVGISGWDGTNGENANVTVDGVAYTAPQWTK